MIATQNMMKHVNLAAERTDVVNSEVKISFRVSFVKFVLF